MKEIQRNGKEEKCKIVLKGQEDTDKSEVRQTDTEKEIEIKMKVE
jgi:hypothetical protein